MKILEKSDTAVLFTGGQKNLQQSVKVETLGRSWLLGWTDRLGLRYLLLQCNTARKYNQLLPFLCQTRPGRERWMESFIQIGGVEGGRSASCAWTEAAITMASASAQR